MILVAAPFMLVLIGMCVSLMMELRKETFESTLPAAVRRAVEHADQLSRTGPRRAACACVAAQ